jgi:hypothetical protein
MLSYTMHFPLRRLSATSLQQKDASEHLTFSGSYNWIERPLRSLRVTSNRRTGCGDSVPPGVIPRSSKLSTYVTCERFILGRHILLCLLLSRRD